jgi:signal transduction histidine kinase
MSPELLYQRYQELQNYVGWTDADAGRVQALAERVEPFLPALIDDFYAEIDRHPNARKVITGGAAQVVRLKGTLLVWVRELFAGCYDADYVARRWRVGWRHVDIGLDQVFTNVALSRLRGGLLKILEDAHWEDLQESFAARRSLNTLLDLDLAIIEDAYQAECAARQQRQDRLAAIGQIAGGIAHELRNPLNVMRTSIYYLNNARNPTAEKRTEHLKRIEQQILLADGVITALSRFAKLPVPDLRPFDVLACVHEAFDAHPLPDNVQKSVNGVAPVPAALGDKDQVRIVLSNLIRNAKEAMPQGGQLTITVRLVEEEVEVIVHDTGVGITPELLHRITEPLYSTKARGLGLGLSIARSILEKNHGSLQAASQVGQGSTFTIRLQAAPTGQRSEVDDESSESAG